MKVESKMDDSETIVRLENRLATGLFKAGAFLVDATRPYAPVDTGALRDSIHVKPIIFLGVLHESTRVTPGVHYDVYQELGTYKMRAHPYLAPGARYNRDKVIEIIVRSVVHGD